MLGKLDMQPQMYATDFTLVDEAGANIGKTHIEAATLQHCVVLGTWPSRGGDRIPNAWWCPAEDGQAERWIKTQQRRVYPSFHALLLDAAAAQHTARNSAF